MAKKIYLGVKQGLADIRLPFSLEFELTFRCSFDCRHCWVVQPDVQTEIKKEIKTEEIKRIIQEGCQLGIKNWALNGGEPLIRKDFPEIFDYLASRNRKISLYTNATLITKEIAALLKAGRCKVAVSMYAATPETYDHITRKTGSYEKFLRGLRYLKESDVDIILQIPTIRSNLHEKERILAFAREHDLSSKGSITWLRSRIDRDPERNRMILDQRFDPAIFAQENFVFSDLIASPPKGMIVGESLYQGCINGHHEIFVDPYGFASFCSKQRDPAFRVDLTQKSLSELWFEDFSAMKSLENGVIHEDNPCLGCQYISYCNWCPAEVFLETGCHDGLVPQICENAKCNAAISERFLKTNIRCWQPAGLPVRVRSIQPFPESLFSELGAASKCYDGESSFATLEMLFDWEDIKLNFEVPSKVVFEDDLCRVEEARSSYLIFTRRESHMQRNDSQGTKPELSQYDFDRFLKCTRDFQHWVIYDVPLISAWETPKQETMHFLPGGVILLSQLIAHHQGLLLNATMIQTPEEKTILLFDPSGSNEALYLLKREANAWWVHLLYQKAALPGVKSTVVPLDGLIYLDLARTAGGVRLLEDHERSQQLILQYVMGTIPVSAFETRHHRLVELLAEEVPTFTAVSSPSETLSEMLENIL